MALIVEDIIRDENLEESQDRMVVVYFQTTPNGDYGDPVATAYAFRDEAVAKDILTEEEWQDATVIDSVYIIKPQVLDRAERKRDPRPLLSRTPALCSYVSGCS
jgi:hypothetical protein